MCNDAIHTDKNWHGVDKMYNDVMGMCDRNWHEPERIVTNW